MLFDEARTHGAGFYRFSRDEVTRAAEQEARSKLSDNYELIAKVKIYKTLLSIMTLLS